MAYGTRYKAEYKQRNGDIITINILKNGYTGTATTISQIKEHAELKYRPQEGSQIIGSELSFSFIAKDKVPFKELMTANYKDFQGEFLINGVKQWTGWLIIDNISTSYFDYVYTFNLSFNDGLAELDRFTPTNDSGLEISGFNTLLWYIKNSIKHNGIPLNFAIVLNTKEPNVMTLATDNALAKCSVIAERFIKIDAGKKNVDTSKEVISQILKLFNCKLYQAAGKYWIINENETGTKVYYHNFADLLQSSTATLSNTVDIGNKKFEKANDLSKKRPVKTVAAIYQNKHIPSNLVTINPNFDTTDISFWNRTTSFTGSFGVVDNELRNTTTDLNGGDCQGTQIFTDTLNIERKGDGDKIKVQFDYYLKNITFINAGNTASPYLEVQLIYQDGSIQRDSLNVIGTGKATFQKDFKNVGTGTYYIKLIDSANSSATYSLIEYRIDNVSVFAVDVDGNSSIVTYDRFYSITQTGSTAIDVNEGNILKLGDGVQINDIGNLRVGNTLTKAWNTAGKAEGLNIQYLYILNLLRLNQKFRNKIRLRIIANDFAKIPFTSQILLETVRYTLSSYSVTYGPVYTGYDFELLELPTAEVTYEKTNIPLRSVNGEKASNELTITETDPTVPDHVKQIATTDINKWNTVSNKVSKAGDTMTGPLTLKGSATGAGAVTKIEFTDSAGTRMGGIADGSGGDSDMYFVSDAGNIRLRCASGFNVLTEGGGFISSGEVTAYSDRRIKKDIKTILSASDVVKNLRGVRYRRTDQESDKIHVGVIAQEVREVLPEVVIYDEKADRFSVNYGAMVAVLIQANKEMLARIEKLEKHG